MADHREIYLDYAATTPVDPVVFDAMVAVLFCNDGRGWGGGCGDAEKIFETRFLPYGPNLMT